jgi:acetylornithine deacetylase/succinyl-diaminopimelate desuccinylase-like protein
MDKQRVLNELAEFIALQSVSADPERFPAIKKTVTFLQKKLESLGFTVKIYESEKTPPFIVASRMLSPNAKTIGIYGHYDVQPEDPVDEWHTQPFELVSQKGKLYGRGVADNKGHVWQNITALEELISSKTLQNNIVFMIEGEEESGSGSFEPFVERAKEDLAKADVFFVTDETMFKKNVPQIGYGLRGLVYFEIEVKISDSDLHSGVWGNRVLNPVLVLTDLFAKMKNVHTGKILIEGYYDKVRKPSPEELKLLEKTKKPEEEEKAEGQVYHLHGVQGLPGYLAAILMPSLDVHGILSGYTGAGAKTVIPKSAMMKFSSRLVEYQDPKEIEEKIVTFIEKNMPKGVQYTLKTLSSDEPFYTSIDNEWVKQTASIFSEIFDNETIFNRSGGSIPAAGTLSRIFKKPIILTGFTLPDCNIHAPDENFDEEMFWKGIEALKKVYSVV